MAVPEIRRGLGSLAPLLIAGTLGACAGAPAPPPATPSPAPPAPAAPPAPPPAPSPPPPAHPGGGIDPGTDTSEDAKSLAQVAQEEKERRARAAAPVAVITNKTLPEYAAKGQLTVATPGASSSPSPAPAGEVPAAERGEQYWRSRGLEIRRRWRGALEEVELLEQSAADLRRRFYSEDDPYRRDGQIKPEWDRVLDRIEEKRAEARAAEEDLETFLEEGREAGALPGWLREGAEEEPRREEPAPAAPEAIEPPELGEGPP